MKIIRMISFLFLISFSIIPGACKKDFIPNISCSKKSNSIDNIRKLIKGNYRWAYSLVTYQLGGSVIETPESEGFNYKYVFQNKGIVDFYENDTLKSHDKYIVTYEFKVTTYPSDSATIVIINDGETGQRKQFFRPYICNDSALFYNPYNSLDVKIYFKRN